MTSKNQYWVADHDGVKALVTGAAYRDFWVRVQGYTETTEPTGQEFQWVRNENHGGYGVLNHEAAMLLAGLGWFPSDPPSVPGMADLPMEPAETPASPPRMAAPVTPPTAENVKE